MQFRVDVTIAELHDEFPLIVIHAHPLEEQSAYWMSSEHEQILEAVNAIEPINIANKINWDFILLLLLFNSILEYNTYLIE
jgi:hypothetical protein